MGKGAWLFFRMQMLKVKMRPLFSSEKNYSYRSESAGFDVTALRD